MSDQLPEGVIALPVVFDLDFLPYYAASRVFEDHAQICEQCHNGAYHRDQFPPDSDPHDLFCEIGLPLMDAVGQKIAEQHHASMLN